VSFLQLDSGQRLVTPGLAVLAALIVLAYCVWRVKVWGQDFGVFDALLIVVSLGALTAAAAPILDEVQTQAAEVTLRQNLRTFREQIERYKLEHRGNVPLLYKNGFPQLVNATDAMGVPGKPGRRYPHGPYLPAGIPNNPFTGSNKVTAVDAFPPPQSTGNGGWLYHQATGRICADQAAYLSE